MIQNTDFTDKIKIEFLFKDIDCNDFLSKLCESFASKITAEQKNKLFFPFKL